MVREALKRPSVRLLRGTRAPARCLRCGGRLPPGDEHVVHVRGDVLHAACALYRPRRRA